MYDSKENTITVNCRSANLTDIDNQLNNPNVLHKENYDDVWLSNTNIVVDEDATLYINSTDTSWLRIAADGKTAYEIHVLGRLKIDSVKISSWNPNTNAYVKVEVEKEDGAKGADSAKIPRPIYKS